SWAPCRRATPASPPGAPSFPPRPVDRHRLGTTGGVDRMPARCPQRPAGLLGRHPHPARRPAGHRHTAHRSRPEAALPRLFQGWYPAILTLIQLTPDDAVLPNDIYDRPPLATWSHGRVRLLGDAAHPMTPNLGQWACQALEDAVVLAASLQATAATADTAESMHHGLQLFQAERLPHATRVATRSRQLGTLIQRPDWLTGWTRDLLIRLLAGSLQVKLLRPFLSHEA